MMKKFRMFAMMVVCAIVAMVMGSCSSDTVDGDDVYQYFWKAQYMEYNIKENKLGITPEKLEQDITNSMTSFNAALNDEGSKVNSAALQQAVVACKTKWQEKGWYPYIVRIKFRIGVFDTYTQRLAEYFTWEIGTDVDAEEGK